MATLAPPRPARLGCETPRIFTPPLRELTPATSLGFECLAFADQVLGIELLPWQRWLLIHALELMPDGTFRFRKIVLLVGRQNGKSTLLQVLTLWRLYMDHSSLVIGTAQNLDIAEEVWQGAVDLAEEIPELAVEIQQVLKVNGKKHLKLKTGERYKVAAASRRGGRGLGGAELVLLDELREHQSWDSWAAVTKTTNAKVRAQIWGVSNAGDAASIVLRYLRKMAHKALGDPDGLGDRDSEIEPDVLVDDDEDDDETSLGIFEWSAKPGCAITDRDGWAQSNPALGHLISERVIAGDAKTDPEWVFRTEVLCQWPEGTLEGPFPTGAWNGSADLESVPESDDVVLGVDVSWDRSTSHVGLAGWREDDLVHIEIIASRTGTDWVIPWLTADERSAAVKGAPVVVQANGAPASSLIPKMLDAGIEVIEWKGADLGRATGAFYDRVRAAVPADEDDDEPPAAEEGLRHRSQPVLNTAAATAVTRPVGDAWVWDRKKSPSDIAPLIAVTGALFGLDSPEPEEETPPEPRVRTIGG